MFRTASFIFVSVKMNQETHTFERCFESKNKETNLFSGWFEIVLLIQRFKVNYGRQIVLNKKLNFVWKLGVNYPFYYFKKGKLKKVRKMLVLGLVFSFRYFELNLIEKNIESCWRFSHSGEKVGDSVKISGHFSPGQNSTHFMNGALAQKNVMTNYRYGPVIDH